MRLAVGDGTPDLDGRRGAARRDRALRRAYELLGDELAARLTYGPRRARQAHIVVPDAAEASVSYATAFGARELSRIRCRAGRR